MIGQVRRESSTVVALVGEVQPVLLAGLAGSPNVSVARGQDEREDGLEGAIRTLRQASTTMSPFVLVPADPLAAVAGAWQAMWDMTQAARGGAVFEEQAAAALAAWRAGRFELPDYYLVLAPAVAVTGGPGFYLGPLRAARPHRVVPVVAPGFPEGPGHPGVQAGPAGPGIPAAPGRPPGQDGPEQHARVLHALRALRHGPWWPPLDDLIDTARHFYAGGMAESGGTRAAPAPS